MITNLSYSNEGKRYKCSLIKRIGDNALILLRTKIGKPISLLVKYDLINVATKRRT